jgi:hypothetical protein
MTRSRLAVSASFLVVSSLSLVAIGALVLDPARAAVGPLPGEALALPPDARFVMGFDVKRFVGSEFYRRYGHKELGRPEAFRDLEEKTGLNPTRDIDFVYVAGRGPEKGDPGSVALVQGRFDRHRISRVIETANKGVTTKSHENVGMYLFREGRRGAMAVAFIDEDTLVLGTQAQVEETITSRVRGDKGLRANEALLALLREVRPGSTFWMVGDQSLLARMPGSVPLPGAAGGGTVALPPLKSVVVTGDLEPSLAMEVVGEARDEAAARNLADVARGFLALAQLQAGQKPELQGLASAVSVTTDGMKVQVSARLPFELLDALQPKKTAQVTGEP